MDRFNAIIMQTSKNQQLKVLNVVRAGFWLAVCGAAIIGWLSFSSIALAADTGVRLTDPLGVTGEDLKGPDVVYILAGRIIKFMLGIVGSLALLMFVYGGVQWLISAGNQDKVKKGRDTLVWAAIGLIVVVASYAILAEIFTIITAT